jgi:hypothetical protein
MQGASSFNKEVKGQAVGDDGLVPNHPSLWPDNSILWISGSEVMICVGRWNRRSFQGLTLERGESLDVAEV